MVSMPTIQSFIKEINDYRTTRSNINITFETLERRLRLDPWLPLVTTVSPSTVSATWAWDHVLLVGLHALVSAPHVAGTPGSYHTLPAWQIISVATCWSLKHGFGLPCLQSVNYQGWGQRVSYPVASVVDASDQDYLKGFTSPLTQTPFYTWGLAQRYPAGTWVMFASQVVSMQIHWAMCWCMPQMYTLAICSVVTCG